VRAAVAAYEATGHMVDAALAYAEHGYPISPVTVRTKSPVAPADKDEHGNKIDRTGSFYKAAINPQQIREWWDGHEYLIALECGPVSGIWMADVDTAEDHASAGVDGWNKLLAEHPTFKTREHRSATGGPHVGETRIVCHQFQEADGRRGSFEDVIHARPFVVETVDCLSIDRG
jgi:Bifunctional DNA primase/polymerase, N-terminal